jgi:hypothetical protein
LLHLSLKNEQRKPGRSGVRGSFRAGISLLTIPSIFFALKLAFFPIPGGSSMLKEFTTKLLLV